MSQYSSAEYVDGALLHIHGHLMIEDERWSAHSSRVLRDSRPLARLDVVDVKVALQILARAILRVQVSAQREELPSLRI